MQEISPDSMVIEHWYPECNPEKRQHNPDMDYENMLGCCKGLDGVMYHCDNFRGKTGREYGNNALLKYNPAYAGHHSLLQIYYSMDGTIHSKDDEFDIQLSSVLNLNNIFLVDRRKQLLDRKSTRLNSSH